MLIELLVGMVLILLLAVLIFTGAGSAFSASDRAKCASNLRQGIARAMGRANES